MLLTWIGFVIPYWATHLQPVDAVVQPVGLAHAPGVGDCQTVEPVATALGWLPSAHGLAITYSVWTCSWRLARHDLGLERLLIPPITYSGRSG